MNSMTHGATEGSVLMQTHAVQTSFHLWLSGFYCVTAEGGICRLSLTTSLHISEHLSFTVAFNHCENTEMTSVARQVSYRLALMLRLDMPWFSGLVQPWRAQILLACYNSGWKSEVPVPNERSHYWGCTICWRTIWTLIFFVHVGTHCPEGWQKYGNLSSGLRNCHALHMSAKSRVQCFFILIALRITSLQALTAALYAIATYYSYAPLSLYLTVKKR